MKMLFDPKNFHRGWMTMFDPQILMSPPSHVIATYRTLCRDGVAGHPLYQEGADGRVAMHVLLELAEGRAALAPISLFGPNDMSKFAWLSHESSSEPEATVVTREGSFFADDGYKLPWQRHFDDEVAWLAACLLGVAGLEHPHSPFRSYLAG